MKIHFKNKTLVELGKGFIALANLVTGLSVVHLMFTKEPILTPDMILSVVGYIFLSGYLVGIILINIGAEK